MGEPAFTIVDVRDRNVFNDGHIMGAMPIPMDELVDRAQSSLEPSRDISMAEDQETNLAAASCVVQFQRVAELEAGLLHGNRSLVPTEGILAQAPVGPEGYNVISQLQHHTETQQSGR